MKSISQIPVSERPREKLLSKGATALSDLELLAIALGSGNKEAGVMELAEKILAVIDKQNGSLKASDLIKVPGIGQAKAALISAMLEFSRRRIKPEGIIIRTASDVVPIIKHMVDRKQEYFICISLNGAHEVIASRIITVGLVNASQVHPREVFGDAITDRACAIIVAHNHPSGDLQPSREDIEVTTRLKEAGNTVGIKLLDHVIFSHRGFYSFCEQGML